MSGTISGIDKKNNVLHENKKSVILCILDGFGLNPQGSSDSSNALLGIDTPCLEFIFRHCPWIPLSASGTAVGLPEGQMGNSEVGHSIIGAGRVVFQDLPRINKALSDIEEFEKKSEIQELLKYHMSNPYAICHIWGLFSDGGVHSHLAHMVQMVKLLQKKGVPMALHLVADGRDVAPQSFEIFLEEARKQISDFDLMVKSVCGRYYAMDRDQRWERTELAVQAVVAGEAENNLEKGQIKEYIKRSYSAGFNDEFLKPAIFGDYIGVKPHDNLIVVNFRPDRIRQFVASCLNNFAQVYAFNNCEVDLDSKMQIIFPKEPINNGLGSIISDNGLTQLRLAETEKYAHVTFFFNGGQEEPYPGEKRVMIPSPKVNSYAEQPAMSAYEITDELLQSIRSGKFNFICVNYANLDMVGHSGDILAAREACKVIDNCLLHLLQTIAQPGDAQQEEIDLFITSDHGNIEKIFDNTTKQPHTAHTSNLVPFIHINKQILDKANFIGELNADFSYENAKKLNYLHNDSSNFNENIGVACHANRAIETFVLAEHNIIDRAGSSAKPHYLDIIADSARKELGSLQDIAPTILACFGIAPGKDMWGNSLLKILRK